MLQHPLRLIRKCRFLNTFRNGLLESVREHQAGLQSIRSMRRIDARRKNARALRLRISQSLVILGKPSAPVEPSNGALDDPTARQHHKPFSLIGALDDVSFELRQGSRKRLLEFRSLIAAIGKQLFQEWIHPEQRGKQQGAAVAILDIGGVNDGVEQQSQRIYENMALLAFDLLARIIAMRIDTGPPFSALLTLWLSMMAAGGLASRSPRLRHST